MNKNIKYLVEQEFGFNISDDDYMTPEDAVLDADIINEYVIEYRPKTHNELRDLVKKLISQGERNLNTIDVSNITDFTDIFNNYPSNLYEDIDFDVSNWDVSNGKIFYRMFQGCKKFNCDLSRWNVSNGIKFTQMFDGCETFNQNLNSWDTSSAKTFFKMFNNCKSYNQPMNNWKTDDVIHFQYMFFGCSSFNQDLNSWNMLQAKNCEGMFQYCTNFNGNISDWKLSTCNSFKNMFSNCTNFNCDLSNWDVSHGILFINMFYKCSSLSFDPSDWNVSYGRDFEGMFAYCDNMDMPLDLEKYIFCKGSYNSYKERELKPLHGTFTEKQWSKFSKKYLKYLDDLKFHLENEKSDNN